MSRLTLVGTVHRDPRGLPRLVETLERLGPDILTLEFSIYGFRYRQKRKKLLRQRLLEGLREIQGTDSLKAGELKVLLRSAGSGGLAALLELPFEYKGATFYSHRHHLPLLYLDVSSYSRQLLSHLDELLCPANLKKLIAFERSPLQEAVEREYFLAKNLLVDGKGSLWRKFIPEQEGWKKRDRVMAERIKKVLAKYPTAQVVHIGGWQHLLAQQGTLFNLLEDLNPKRILLGHLQL